MFSLDSHLIVEVFGAKFAQSFRLFVFFGETTVFLSSGCQPPLTIPHPGQQIMRRSFKRPELPRNDRAITWCWSRYFDDVMQFIHISFHWQCRRLLSNQWELPKWVHHRLGNEYGRDSLANSLNFGVCGENSEYSPVWNVVFVTKPPKTEIWTLPFVLMQSSLITI